MVLGNGQCRAPICGLERPRHTLVAVGCVGQPRHRTPMSVHEPSRGDELEDRALVLVRPALVFTPMDERAAHSPVAFGVDPEEPLPDLLGGGERLPDALRRSRDLDPMARADLAHLRVHTPASFAARDTRSASISASSAADSASACLARSCSNSYSCSAICFARRLAVSGRLSAFVR